MDFFNFLPDGTGVLTFVIVFFMQFIMRSNINTILGFEERPMHENDLHGNIDKLFFSLRNFSSHSKVGQVLVGRKVFPAFRTRRTPPSFLQQQQCCESKKMELKN